MSDVVYTGRIRIEKKEGSLRYAYLPATEEPVRFGVHSAIAGHYGRQPELEDATTLDYVMAATAG